MKKKTAVLFLTSSFDPFSQPRRLSRQTEMSYKVGLWILLGFWPLFWPCCASISLEYITQCGNSHNFSVIQILREIKFGESRVSKSAILIHHLLTLNLDFLGIHEGRYDPNQQTSKPQTRQFWNFYIYPNWFHVNSEWQRNPEISILCIINHWYL